MGMDKLRPIGFLSHRSNPLASSRFAPAPDGRYAPQPWTLPKPSHQAQDNETYERAACTALSLAHPRDIETGKVTSLHHHLGNFKIAESLAAVRAVAERYRRDSDTNFYTFREYRHAIGNVKSITADVRREEAKLHNEVCDDARQFDRDNKDGFRDVNAKVQELKAWYYESLRNLRKKRSREYTFLDAYSYEKCTANIAGYLHYLEKTEPQLFDILNRSLLAYVPEKPRTEHSYVVAATGGGKSELLKALIYSYVTQPGAPGVVVLDPNGDFVRQIARWPEFVGMGGERLIYFEHSLKEGMTPTINPLQICGLSPHDRSQEALDRRRLVARQLLGAFEQVIAGRMGSNITVPMEAILIPCLLTLFEHDGATLRDLARFMDDDQNEDLIAEGVARAHDPDNALFFQTAFNDKRYTGTKGSIFTKLQSLLGTGFFADLTCGSNTIDLRRAMDERKIVLFNLRQGKLDDVASAFGRLLVASIQGIANQRDDIEEDRRTDCHFIIDECHFFITPSIRKIMLEARKFKVYLTLCQQLVGENMSRDLTEVVIGSANVNMIGRARKGTHQQPAELADVEPDDILNLGRGQFYIRSGDSPPFKLTGRTDLLGTAHQMTDASWRRRIEWQVKDYYRPREQRSNHDQSKPPSYDEQPTKSTDVFR